MRARRRASTGGILPRRSVCDEDDDGSAAGGGKRRGMDNAALVLWLLTAGGGLTLAAIWLVRGGLRQRDEVLEVSYADVARATDVAGDVPTTRRSRLPVWMISTHAALAVLGLLLWAFYVDHEGEEGTGVGALPPLVVALLVLVAALGALMVRRWREDRRKL